MVALVKQLSLSDCTGTQELRFFSNCPYTKIISERIAAEDLSYSLSVTVQQELATIKGPIYRTVSCLILQVLVVVD